MQRTAMDGNGASGELREIDRKSMLGLQQTTENGLGKRGNRDMTLTQKRIVILLAVIIVAAILGRLAVRAVMNLLLGGTLFGGNFL